MPKSKVVVYPIFTSLSRRERRPSGRVFSHAFSAGIIGLRWRGIMYVMLFIPDDVPLSAHQSSGACRLAKACYHLHVWSPTIGVHCHTTRLANTASHERFLVKIFGLRSSYTKIFSACTPPFPSINRTQPAQHNHPEATWFHSAAASVVTPADRMGSRT